MSGNSIQLVQRLWNYRNILPDDGLSHGDHVEQFYPAVAGLFPKTLGDARCNR